MKTGQPRGAARLRDLLFRYSSPHGVLLEKCDQEPLLPSGEAAIDRAVGRRHCGLATSTGQRLSDAAQQSGAGSHAEGHQEERLVYLIVW